MNEKTYHILKKTHLLLMAMLIVISLLSIAKLFTIMESPEFQSLRLLIRITIPVLFFCNIAALICGLIYLQRDYRKDAAKLYKIFMFMNAMVAFFSALIAHGFEAKLLSIAVAFIRFILLLVLTFGKDLGKKYTWLVFAAVFILDIIFSFILAPPFGLKIVLVTSRLLINGTIGLAIMGKYHDKDQRGTV